MNKLVVSTGFFFFASTSLSVSQPVFGPPVNLGPKINSPHFEADPFLTADGKKLFFAGGEGRTYSYGKEDIWFAEWTDTGWTTAQILGPQINSSRREKSPSISPDGQKLYYVDDSRDGTNWDIWVSTWDSSLGDWGIPQNLGHPVNTSGLERSARISPDGGHLYFSSKSEPDSLFPQGRCGIYMSEWDGQNWSVPQRQWGCGARPEFPTVTADGRWLFFEDGVLIDPYTVASSILVTSRKGADWSFPPVDLQTEIGVYVWTPFITPSGDSLFFASGLLGGGLGSRDILMTKRLLPGDLDLDGVVTIVDVTLEINKVFLSEPYPAPLRLGDLNCDAVFSPVDVVLILNAIFSGNFFPCS